MTRNKTKKYTFYETLQVLYTLIDEESETDSGTVLEEMNRIKKSIVKLAADVGNLALNHNWYVKKSKKLTELIDYDEKKGYTPKREIKREGVIIRKLVL